MRSTEGRRLGSLKYPPGAANKQRISLVTQRLLAIGLIALIAGISPKAVVPLAAFAPQQAPHNKQAKTKKTPAGSPKDVALPFRAGEKLNYQVSWSAFLSAASVELTIPEQRNLYGSNTWHFRATAHTQGTARTLFPIDDEFDSYTNALMTGGQQYETYLNEMGRKQDQVLHFVVEGKANTAPVAGVIVWPGTFDPLGALFTLRTIDWQKTTEWQAPVYDGRDVYELKAKPEAENEAVKVAAGNYSATRVSLRVWKHGKELSDIDFSVWLAHDAARTPVMMRAELPLGSVSVELASSSQ
jgi:Protein of unknown function (DUF3108)